MLFQKELERWRGIIQDVLIKEINVPREIAMSVVIAPAGHYDDHQLPDRDYWLSTLWFHCLEAIATPEGRAALVSINALRLRHQNKLKDKDFEQYLEDQPLVLEGLIPKNKMSLPSAIIPVGSGPRAVVPRAHAIPYYGTGAGIIAAAVGAFGAFDVGTMISSGFREFFKIGGPIAGLVVAVAAVVIGIYYYRREIHNRRAIARRYYS